MELGHLLWPKLATAYIEQRLSPAVPQSEAGLDAFQTLAKAAERLEGEATATGCVFPPPMTLSGIDSLCSPSCAQASCHGLRAYSSLLGFKAAWLCPA